MPWPDKSLSPNARIHWAKKASIVKRQRRLAYVLAIKAGWHLLKFQNERIHLWMDFYPPTRRMPDDDNLLISMKPARDGIADALGIDDKRFVSHPFVSDKPVKGGEVRIRISAEPRT